MIKYAMNFLFMTTLIMVFVDYFVSVMELNDSENYLILSKSSSKRCSEMSQILANVRDLTLLEKGVYNPNPELEVNTDIFEF